MKHKARTAKGAASVADERGFLHRFLRLSETQPDTTAIHVLDDDTRLSYRGLREKAEGYCGAFAQRGVQAGERVLLMLPNGPDLVAAYIALVGLGAVPVMINDKLTSHEFGRLARDAQPVAAITTAALAGKHAAVFSELTELKTLFTADVSRKAAPVDARQLAFEQIEAAPRALTPPANNPIVTIQYTYKGLGEPLPVAHRYLALTHSSDGIHEHFIPQQPGTAHLVALPLYAVFGLVMMMVFPLSIGATMLITNSILRHDIVEALARHRVTFACLVPDLMRLLIAQLGKRTAALPQLHADLRLYSGGSYLTPEDTATLNRLLGRDIVLQGFGLTECMPMLVQSSVATSPVGTLGKAISGVQLRVVDDAGGDVQTGRIGELLVKGATVAEGYLNRPEASARFFRDGWLHTGDLVRLDAEGHVFFIGRRLRISKLRAQMVDLAEVEQAAAKHPQVLRSRARISRDAQGINSLQLSVETREDIDRTAFNAHLSAQLSGFKLPRSVDFVTGGAA